MSSYRITLDMIACEGHGICAETFPERISLDDWGYPIIDSEPFDGASRDHAKRAVEMCPELALRVERIARADPR
jgi:ferredoxin